MTLPDHSACTAVQQSYSRRATQQTSMDATLPSPRSIVVAVDASDSGVAAVQYAVSEVIRPGDVLHICHVATVLPPASSISHVAPQTTFDVPEGDVSRQQLVEKVQAFVKAKYQSIAELYEVPCFPHIYLDTDNATAADIAAVVCKACEEIPADLLIIAYRGDEGIWSKLSASLPMADLLLPPAKGATLHAIMAQSRIPVLVVKQYRPGMFGRLAGPADVPASS